MATRRRNVRDRLVRRVNGRLFTGDGSKNSDWAHMILGSVRVRIGQRVRVGQRIGLLGNSGNTTGPHLHFGIQSRPDCLSRSEPFEIGRYTLQGTAAPTGPPGRIRVIGPSRRERRSLPLILSVATFLPPAR